MSGQVLALKPPKGKVRNSSYHRHGVKQVALRIKHLLLEEPQKHTKTLQDATRALSFANCRSAIAGSTRA
eukprot:6049713-Alexandrium_andersonii.AAC.1